MTTEGDCRGQTRYCGYRFVIIVVVGRKVGVNLLGCGIICELNHFPTNVINGDTADGSIMGHLCGACNPAPKVRLIHIVNIPSTRTCQEYFGKATEFRWDGIIRTAITTSQRIATTLDVTFIILYNLIVKSKRVFRRTVTYMNI